MPHQEHLVRFVIPDNTTGTAGSRAGSMLSSCAVCAYLRRTYDNVIWCQPVCRAGTPGGGRQLAPGSGQCGHLIDELKWKESSALYSIRWSGNQKAVDAAERPRFAVKRGTWLQNNEVSEFVAARRKACKYLGDVQ